MIDLTKIKSNKALQIVAIIAIPAVIVGAYFGYKYIKKKSDEKKLKEEVDSLNKIKNAETLSCREKYKEINSVDDFLAGIKCVKDTSQFGYDLTLMAIKPENTALEVRGKIEKMGMDKLKRLYELTKKTITEKTPKEQEEWLDLMHLIYT
jgi:hypothetical protein